MKLRRKADTLGRLKGEPDADKIMIADYVECHVEGTMGKIPLKVIKRLGRLPLSWRRRLPQAR